MPTASKGLSCRCRWSCNRVRSNVPRLHCCARVHARPCGVTECGRWTQSRARCNDNKAVEGSPWIQNRREIFKVAKSRSKSILRDPNRGGWGSFLTLVIVFAPQPRRIDFDLDFATLGFSPGKNPPISQKITTIGEDVRPAGSRSHRIRCGLVEAAASIILVRVQSLACPSLIQQLWH